MKGLEITLRTFSEVKAEHLFFRFDSEHCQKAYLANLARIKKWPNGFIRLGDELEDITGGATPLGANYPESGVRFLRVQNIMRGYVDDTDMAYITAADDAELSRSRLRTDDVLLTITGVSYGKSAVVTPEFAGSNMNQHSVRMHLRDGTFRPVFLSVFLNAAPGKLQSDQNITGITRPALDYTTIRNFILPRVSDNLQAAVESCVRLAHESFGASKAAMLRAEEILLAALGLGDWQPPEPLTYTRRASEAFAVERLDAEFFQEQFVACRRRLLEAGALEFIAFDGLLETLTNGHTPLRHDLSVGEVPFLCAEHVTDFECHYDSEKRILPAHHTGELGRTAVRNGDVLLTIKGRIGNFAIAENVLGPVNINQDVALARLNCRLPKWWVVTFLNSRLGKLLVQQFSTGGINPFLGLSNVRKLPIPRFQDGLMNEVAEATRARVHAARAARARARELLERAKRAVEIAIEQGEKAALELIA